MLAAGMTLGPYRILAPLGAGGMGEVYRARDTRLARDVAIKVIPAELARDPDRLRRFEQEARAVGALNHANVVTIFDVGTNDSAPYVVMELLEGESLRARLRAGPLPLRKALEYAAHVAHGLAAAHDKGIVHRDLKPENLFVTKDGRVKVLDFGLAKLTRPELLSSAADPTRSVMTTETGTIMGTAGYMAPEQLRGLPADARSDLFALGAIAHEMVSGRPAFKGASFIETAHSILNEEPEPLSALRAEVPPMLESLVRHCLEKEPAQRFQSARDVAFALESLAGSSGLVRPAEVGPAATTLRRGFSWLVWVALVTFVVATAIVISLRTGGRPQPSFERLTFRRGGISSARLSADGATVVYSAAWDGEPTRVYSTRLDSRESSPLPLPDARLLALSSSGDLAIAVGPGMSFAAGVHTTLARVPLAGGAPREIAEGITEADWSPGDRELAVVHDYSDRMALEYPIGTEIWRTTTGIISPRVSPRGDLIAFVELDTRSDFTRGYVAVVDRAGRMRRLTGLWENVQGLAWSPRGDEVWFTAAHHGGSAKAVWTVSLRGRERLLFRMPGNATLRDVARDGQVLLSEDNWRISLLAKPPGETRERDLSWQDMTALADLSADGTRLVFTEYSEAYGKAGVIGMRATDGSPVVHLGDGYAGGLSPDGRWVVAIINGARPHVSLLPTGAGRVRALDPGPVKDFGWSCWAPDGRRILFGGVEPGHAARAYVQEIGSGLPRAITPEGVDGWWRGVTPDGRSLMAVQRDSLFLFPLDGGAPKHLSSPRLSEGHLQWLPDGKSVLLASPRNVIPVHVERMELATGERRPICDLRPQDPAGVSEIIQIVFAPDLRAWAYTYRRVLSDLYLVKGLR